MLSTALILSSSIRRTLHRSVHLSSCFENSFYHHTFLIQINIEPRRGSKNYFYLIPPITSKSTNILPLRGNINYLL